MRNLIEIAIHNSISEKGGQNRRPKLKASMIDRQTETAAHVELPS